LDNFHVPSCNGVIKSDRLPGRNRFFEDRRQKETYMNLIDIPTPALILDLAPLRRNCAAMRRRMEDLGVEMRPHAKTPKSIDVAHIATEGFNGALTVSTLKEAEYFIHNGVTDITYAVPIEPAKLDQIPELQRAAAVHILTDNVDTAKIIARRGEELRACFSVFIEIDTGYGRSGLKAGDDELVAIGQILNNGAFTAVQGVLSHAGHSYGAKNVDEIKAIAAQERDGLVAAADELRSAGVECPVVSAGSTPTMRFAADLTGVNEARPGNYQFYDLYQAGLGCCPIEDIAVSVLSSIISVHPERNHALCDAGGLALSLDHGAHEGPNPGVGYGLVRDIANSENFGDVIVNKTSQEHGWLASRNDNTMPFGAMPVGGRIRILPNHSCMTAAAYDKYYVVDGGAEVVDQWFRVNYW